MTRDEFIKKATLKHGDKYDYSKINIGYKNGKERVIITCKIHGDFEQVGESHLFGCGCNKCAMIIRMKSLISNNNDFISKSIILHGDKYDYSKVKYINAKTKVVIICKAHGEFEQTPNDHLTNHGCPICGEEVVAIKRTKNTDYFTEVANKIHGNKYDYSKTEYVNSKNKITIICPKHGEFTQKANSHLNGQGCPTCNESTGERCVNEFLKTNNIDFDREKSFNDCKYKKKLQFDFFLYNLNTCIEYDGIQHYEPIKHFGGQRRFDDLKIKDKIKTQYCLDNNIKLIRIPYTEIKNIKDILKKELKL